MTDLATRLEAEAANEIDAARVALLREAATAVRMMGATAFTTGDKVWCIYNGNVIECTVGKVTVEIVDTPGINRGYVEPDAPGICFSNYAPAKSRTEQYMMVETGVGSGAVYTLGKSVFATREAAEAARGKA